MAYTLGQYNQSFETYEDNRDSDYMSLKWTNGSRITASAKRAKRPSDLNVTTEEDLNIFYDEVITVDSNFTKDEVYYLHAKIKRIENKTQIFKVFLCAEENGDISASSQFLKNVVVADGPNDSWVDFEMIFSPIVSNFNCIMFFLQREVSDYRDTPRYPFIVYEELSRVKNALPIKIEPEIEQKGLIKIGVQSHPGLKMCINREEIHVGRTGVYEMRNGIIKVDFFSVITPAKEKNDQIPLPYPNNNVYKTMEEYLEWVANEPLITSESKTNSRCIIENDKFRTVDAFTLDYVYKNNKTGG